jgi:hypothetical protein
LDKNTLVLEAGYLRAKTAPMNAMRRGLENTVFMEPKNTPVWAAKH